MRVFIDLWVKKLDEDMLELLYRLGFRAAAVEEYEENLSSDKVVLVKKRVLEAYKWSELKEKLRGAKKNRVVVSVKPLSVEVARMSVHDSRVDTIVIDEDTMRYMDKNQFSLMKQFSKPVELPLNKWLNYPPRIKAMIYRRIHNYIYRTKLPVIVSSAATRWNEILIPRSTITLLETMFNVSKRDALLYMASYPREILVRNGVVI